MTIDTQWFTTRLADRKLSQRQLAKLMGIDPSAISLMLRGKRKMTVEEAAQIAVLLQSSTTDVLEAAGVSAGGGVRIKIIGYVHGDLAVTLEAEGLHDTVEAPPGLPADAVAVQARTARSDQDVMDGWLYFMSAAHGPPDKAVGCLAVVAIRDDGLHLAHVRRGYRRGSYNLVDPGGKQQQNVLLAWASPVLWIKTVA